MSITRLFWVLAVVCMSLGSSEGKQGKLPPTDAWPRTRPEWDARMAERRSLAGPTFKDALPEFAPHFDRMQERQRAIARRCIEDKVVCDEGMAAALIDELYVDYGHPVLNAAAQNFIVGAVVGQLLREPEARLTAASRSRLAQGLLEYVAEGGGQHVPCDQAELAVVLGDLAPGDPVVQETAELLLEDSIVWAHEVGFLDEYDGNLARRRWGDLTDMRIYELTLPASALPPRPPKRYQEVVRKLRELLTERTADEDLFLRRVRQASGAALAPFSDCNLLNDLLSRLLVVYRTLLSRGAALPEKVAEYIQEDLLRLARERRLRTERHWDLWVQAVTVLREDRISGRMRSGIKSLLELRAVPEGVAERIRYLAEPPPASRPVSGDRQE